MTLAGAPAVRLHRTVGRVLYRERKVDGEAARFPVERAKHLDAVQALLFAEARDGFPELLHVGAEVSSGRRDIRHARRMRDNLARVNLHVQIWGDCR